MNNPIFQKFLIRIQNLEQGLRELTTLSARSEWTGGFGRITFAELPVAGMRGRVYYITDARIGVEPPGAGSGALGIDNGTQWVYVNDPTTAIVV